MSRPMFISFLGNMKGRAAAGWVVFSEVDAVTRGLHVELLCRKIEEMRGYDADSVVVTNFRRLED